MLAGDRDRERAAVTVRKHYVDGRLTLDELSDRTERILASRSRAELRSALSGLPWLSDAVAAQGRSVVQAAVRGALLVFFTGIYVLFSFALLLVLALAMLFNGVSGSALAGFVIVWLVPTYLLTRLWQRRPPGQRPST